MKNGHTRPIIIRSIWLMVMSVGLIIIVLVPMASLSLVRAVLMWCLLVGIIIGTIYHWYSVMTQDEYWVYCDDMKELASHYIGGVVDRFYANQLRDIRSADYCLVASFGMTVVAIVILVIKIKFF